MANTKRPRKQDTEAKQKAAFIVSMDGDNLKVEPCEIVRFTVDGKVILQQRGRSNFTIEACKVGDTEREALERFVEFAKEESANAAALVDVWNTNASKAALMIVDLPKEQHP